MRFLQLTILGTKIAKLIGNMFISCQITERLFRKTKGCLEGDETVKSSVNILTHQFHYTYIYNISLINRSYACD